MLIGKATDRRKTKHSSLGDRLACINSDFFRKIYEFLHEQYQEEIQKKKHNIIRFDSTLVELSVKLLTRGIRIGSKNTKTRRIKYTIGLHGFLPTEVQIFQKQEHLSEEVALRETILNADIPEGSIILFDRGLQRRKTLAELADRNILFITRGSKRLKYRKIKTHKDVRGRKTKTLILQEDSIVQLKSKNTWEPDHYRLIRAISLKNREELFFLTNIVNLNAREITDLYKQRWEIEVFFKFLKQHLHFSHVLSRTDNGIRGMLYMTLILSILLTVYKKKQNRKL